MEKESLYILKLDTQGSKVKFPNADMPAKLGEYTYTAQRMAGTPTLTATLNYPSCLDELWTGEEFVEFRGEKYYIDQVPTSSKDNKSIMYKHELQFVSERIVLENVYFMDVVTAGEDTYHSNSTSVKFMGDINEFVGRLNASMAKSGIGYSIVIDEDITSESKLVSLDSVYLAEALQSIYTIYELPYYFVGKVCHIGYTENVISTPFEYKKGLVSIKKTNANYKTVNRVTGVGSSDNIPFYYPNDDEKGTIERTQNLMPSIYRQTNGAERFYNALNDTYKIPGTNDYYFFKNTYSSKKVKEIKVDFSDIKPTIENVTNASGQLFGEIADIAFDDNDSDELGTGEGNNIFNGTDEYVHSYFYIKLHIYNGDYGFNLFEQGLEGGTAVINMTTGNCAACEFEIGVTYKDNEPGRAFNPVLVDSSGNLPAGDFEQKVTSQTSQYIESQQNTSTNEVWIAVKKDNTTFGVVMPNATNNYKPSVGDKFVITGIKMPKSLVLAAEKRLDEALIKYMSENNDEKFSFSVSFSRVFLAENSMLAGLLNENSRIYIKYNDKEYFMYVNSFTCKADKNCLYDISVELTDKLSANVSALRSTITEIAGDIIGERMGVSLNVSDILGRISRYFISKINNDTANELITFLKGLLIGKNGSGITVLENGMSQAVVDYLYVKVKAVFDELEVKKKTYVGGEQVISHAGMKCNRVDELDDVYRCYFKEEEDGIEIENQFTPGSLAIAQECNIKTGISHHVGNRYYWRLVTAVGENYIDLSKTVCDPNVENDVPVAGDDIVGLGHKTDITRQAAIILSSVNEVSPSIIMYQGINDFTLTGKDVISFDFDRSTGKARMKVYGDTYIGDKDRTTYMEYTQDKGVDIKGMFHIEQGSTGWKNMEGLPDEIQAAADLAQEAKDAIDNAAVGSVNLLRNSGFTGNYSPADLNFNTELSDSSEVYSDKLNYWSNSGASVIKDTSAVSGYSVTIGSISQVVNALIPGENYVVSFKAKGENVTVTCGGWNTRQPLTSSYQKFVFKFTFNGAKSLALAGACTLCDIQLERGTIATDWAPNPLDRDDFYSTFLALKYLTDYIKDGSVDILGGLILAGAILLGNYKDGRMREVTAGISGTYNDGDDVSFFSGGNLEKAIRTVMKYKDDPGYVPSEDELKKMANFVVTHGGRAILNDVALRGYIHGLGGFFRGRLETSVEGKRIVIDPEKNTLEMYTTEGHATLVMRFDTSSDGWEYGDLILRKYAGDQLIQETTVYPERIRIQNHVDNTDIILNPNNVSFYGSKGETLLVGMKPVYNGASVSRYVANIECSNWPSRDNVSSGQVYVEYETVEGVVTNGILKVKK
nr:MAG TPA: tail protein [Caudoviricetes sp.]